MVEGQVCRNTVGIPSRKASVVFWTVRAMTEDELRGAYQQFRSQGGLKKLRAGQTIDVHLEHVDGESLQLFAAEL